ncbi:MAG: acyl-CoA dehydrogenase C-terminal domain-containing protein [Rhizomicrobium sp.]|jgi:alkylation response protein AidB-like acyl-CoA dehydrogenase
MPVYRAPVEDYRFLMHELFEVEKQTDLPRFADLTADLVDDILSNAGKFCEEVLHPINQSGDEEGCHYENGVVRTPAGFKEAFKAYSEAGWGGLGAPTQFGGSNLPMMVTMAVAEMAQSANQAFAMYPGLTGAAYSALGATGAPWMKEHIVPKMVAGEWTGTMCLTEPNCGTDLRLMKTRAVEQPDGTYRMTGTKIFISGGDHDLTDNIIHMVIAKIPDENGQIHDDLSTVNFFMVPKYIVKEDGSPGPRNGVTCGGIEKKMGIKGSATCILNFDDAIAWRLGPKPTPPKPGEKRSASEGMKGMFGMMNGARLGVGIQGISVGEVAYQNGVAYSLERRAGHALTGPAKPDKPADVLMVQPDIRRMLLHSRAFVEGARAMAMWTTLNMSIADSSRPESATAGMLADLMTPVIKAFFTDMGFEAANMGMQCYGGHGYIRDNGVEQFVRDGRINQTYEGANGVQAMDLVGRKLGRKGGAAPMALFGLISGWLGENASDDKLAPFTKPVKRGLDTLQQATLWLAQNGMANPNNAGAGAVDYLRMMGIVVVGWMWARMAKLAQAKLAAGAGNKAFYEGKLVSARYWMERMIPECSMLFERIQAGADTIMAFAPAAE